MFDTMTMTKAVGAVCGATLIFLFANWGAEIIYHGGEEGGAAEEAQAYSVDTGASEAPATDEAAAGPTYTEVAATADAAAGEKVFSKCKACHKIDGSNGTGPHLNGVVGRARGSVDGFGYSDGMKSVSDPWTGETLFAFLQSPKAYVAGTKMGFAGLPKPEDRANLIAYLETLK
jgi:cytochrome c